MYKNTQNGQEWYLRDAGGQDIGVIDITNDDIEWYLYGNEMFASLRPTDDEKYILLDKNTTSATFSPSSEDPFDDAYKSRYDLRPDSILIHQYDHLGNTRLVYYVKYMGGTNNYNYYARDVLDYYPYAKTLRSWHYNQDTVRYQSTNHERDKETGLDYRWARLYDSDLGRFNHPDAMRSDYPSLASYHYTAGNPVMFTDPSGNNLNPIYDRNGNFLGTDDKGLQGDARILHKEDFTQGMSHKKAEAWDVGIKGLKSESAYIKYSGHFSRLDERPDYDGYLTFGEATRWSNQGEGKPLFVDARKIDLSPKTVSDVKDAAKNTNGYIDFFSDLKGDPNTGRVYGTLKVTLTDENSGAVRLGGKNSLLDVHDFSNPITKAIDDWLSPGEPQDFNIYCAPCNSQVGVE